MPNYQDHLLFGAVLVMVFSSFAGSYLTYSIGAVIVSAAFILLAAVFPDIDHKGSVVHRKLRALLVILAAGGSAGLAYPDPVLMLAGSALTTVGVYYVFEAIKPRHRGVTHTFRFCVLFSGVIGFVSLLAFDSFLPAVFTFVSYLSHLALDGTLSNL